MPAEQIQPFTGTARFAVVRQIGAGGMGVVYEAYDRERQERVALKTLPQVEARGLYRLKQEFRSLADVTHPNLVALHELLSTGEGLFFTMELVEGVTFLEYVRGTAGGPASSAPTKPVETCAESGVTAEASADGLPATRPVPLAASVRPRAPAPSPSPPAEFGRLRAALRELAEGVCALHQAGKLHRDLKPTNVLVTPLGRVVVLDFGLVTELEEGSDELPTEEARAGTVAYMSPEQAAGLPLSEASDWYCVGVMMHEALTGRRPFLGSQEQVLREKQECEPCPPSDLVPSIPDDLNALCLTLLRRQPEERPSGADILRRLGESLPRPETLPAEPAPPRGKGPFVGRQQHLAALHEAYLATRRGRAVAVFVHGRSGVGKSLLVRRFLDELGREVVVLAGRCYERESVPYKALDSLVDAMSRFLGRLSYYEAAELLPRDVWALARVFPVLRRAEAVARAPRQTVAIPDLQELRRRAFAALRELLARLGDRKPLVLAIDDLQWGDVDSASLLTDLLRPPDPPTLFLVASYRSEYVATSSCLRALLEARQASAGTTDQRDLAVEPLSMAQARALALELLGDAAGEAALAEVIAQESGGNPYFVHELVQYLQSGAALADAAALAGKITLDEVLWQRVLRLPESSRRLLEIVAVSGRPLRQADAYAAVALPRADHAALSVLRNGRLVMSTGPGGEDQVETYHDRIRETIIARLRRDLLKEHHQRLAITLEGSGRADPETLAIHYHEADERETASRYYAAAADQAAEALAFDRAVKLYRLALELRPAAGVEGRRLRSQLADALANAGRGGEAAQDYLTAAEGADAVEALEFQRRAAMQLLISGHFDRGLAVLGRVLRAVGMRLPATPGRALWSLLCRRAQLRLRGLRFRQRDASQVAAADLRRIDICWSAIAGLSMIDPIQGAYFQARSLLLALRAGEPYRLGRALAVEAGHVATGGSRTERRTSKLLQAAEQMAQAVANPHLLGLMALMRGGAAYLSGQWKQASEFCDQAEAIFRDSCTGVAWELDTAHNFALWSLVYMGEVAELARRWPVLLKEAQERGDLYAVTTLSTHPMSMVRLADDDPEGAARQLRQAMADWSQQGFHVQHLNALFAQLNIDLYTGQGEAAWRHATEQAPAIARSLLMRIQLTRIFHRYQHACSALAAARGIDKQALAGVAEHDARQLHREKIPWAEALAVLVTAGVAVLRGDRGRATGLYAAAAAAFEGVHMPLPAAAALRRHGELLGGEAGEALIARADCWMKGQKIQNPRRMTAMYAPVDLVSGRQGSGE